MAIGTTAAIIGGSVIGGAASLAGAKGASKAAGKAADATVAEQRRQFDLVRGDTQGLRDLGNSAVGSINRLYGYAPPAAAPLSFEQWSQQQPAGRVGFTDGRFGSSPMGNVFGQVLAARQAPTDLRGQYEQYLAGQKPAASKGPDLSGFFASPDYNFNLQEGQKAIDNSAVARGGLLSGAAVKAGQRYASGLASREFSSFYDRLAQQAGLGVTGIGASASAGMNAAGNIGNAYMNAGAQRGSAYLQGAAGLNNAVQGGLGNILLQRYLGTGVGGIGGMTGIGGGMPYMGGLA